ncbi:hypothetical protein KEJ32_03260, partial [Candidatus Bathyarchaeota archaeon]|nr:hypothetical protein [Candidatus Bathyarchaeota archaeon]
MLIINTCGEKVLAIADLVYINGFPLRYAFSLPGINYKKRCYSRLYDLFSKPLDFVKPHIIVANSKFVAEIVGSFLSREILVIHP